MQLSALRARSYVVLLAGIIAGLGITVAGAADLSASEKQHYDLAKKYLAQLQTNLKLARDTAGSGEDAPQASKARLAMARLQTARQSAAQVEARLEKLPAANADVKALQAGYDEQMKAVAALEERLTRKPEKPKGGEAPKGTPKDGDDGPPTPAGEQLLGYQAENALKIAQSNINEVTAYADRLEKAVAEMSATKDKSAISLIDVRRAEVDTKEARRKAGFADAQFKKLPAEHSRVKAAADALKAALARIDASEKALEPIAKQLMKGVDPSSYPELKADNDRLKELREMVTFGSLESDRPAVAEVVKQLPAMKQESARLLAKYGPLLSQNIGESNMLKGSAQQLDYALEKFEEALGREKQVLPGQIDADLERVVKLTEEAVRDAKPAYFPGGIASTLAFAEDRLVLYQVLDPEGGKAAAGKIAKARADVKQKQQSLSGAIIESNELPPDRYAGPDKADLAKRATEALKKQRPQAQVLAVRFPSDQWKRETKLRYENRSWRKIDRSRLQAQVITRRDDKIAEIHPINLWTDHMDGDAISAIPLYGAKEELEPQSLMPVAKVK